MTSRSFDSFASTRLVKHRVTDDDVYEYALTLFYDAQESNLIHQLCLASRVGLRPPHLSYHDLTLVCNCLDTCHISCNPNQPNCLRM